MQVGPLTHQLQQVRRDVFIVEQRIPEDMEWDADDALCLHALAEDAAGQPVATGRLLADGHIGRIAVLSGWRGRGARRGDFEYLIGAAERRGHAELLLNAQTHAARSLCPPWFRALRPRVSGAGIAPADAAPGRTGPRYAVTRADLTSGAGPPRSWRPGACLRRRFCHRHHARGLSEDRLRDGTGVVDREEQDGGQRCGDQGGIQDAVTHGAAPCVHRTANEPTAARTDYACLYHGCNWFCDLQRRLAGTAASLARKAHFSARSRRSR